MPGIHYNPYTNENQIVDGDYGNSESDSTGPDYTVSELELLEEEKNLLREQLHSIRLRLRKINDRISQLTETKKTPKENKTPKEREGKKKESIFDRLTDHRSYTGTHVHRFNSDGSGRGLAGRRTFYHNGVAYDDVFPRDKARRKDLSSALKRRYTKDFKSTEVMKSVEKKRETLKVSKMLHSNHRLRFTPSPRSNSPSDEYY